MFLFLLLILLILFLYYLEYTDMFRYFQILDRQDISFYDNKYINLPKCDKRTVITLTTIPSRIDKIKPTLISLLDQTMKVDTIYVNIPYFSLKGEEYIIPEWLKNLHNITINRVEKDYGPATKLLPILKKEKNAKIIVVDDDVIYGSRMVENYIKNFKGEALTIFGADISEGKLKDEWPTYLRYRSGKYVDVLMGHNSFLVTPDMFSLDVFDYSKAPKECLYVDDIWFSFHVKTKIYSLGFQYKNIPITSINDSGISLCSSVNSDNKNNEISIQYFQNQSYFQNQKLFSD